MWLRRAQAFVESTENQPGQKIPRVDEERSHPGCRGRNICTNKNENSSVRTFDDTSSFFREGKRRRYSAKWNVNGTFVIGRAQPLTIDPVRPEQNFRIRSLFTSTCKLQPSISILFARSTIERARVLHRQFRGEASHHSQFILCQAGSTAHGTVRKIGPSLLRLRTQLLN
jgi:hypothetical protein